MAEAQTATDTVSLPEPEPLSPAIVGKQAKAVFIFAALLSVAAIVWPRGDGTTTAPAGFLLDAGGRPTTLGDHLTPVTLLHFWATWCPPCITEIPALERLAQDFSDKPTFQVTMVAVADELEKVRPFVGRQRAFGVVYDPQWEVAHRYGTRKLPETYLIVRGKKLERLKFVGAQNWDDPKIRAALTQVVERTEAGADIEQIIEALDVLPPEIRG